MNGKIKAVKQRLALRTLYLSVVLSSFCTACSPAYVIEAGWTEAGILWRREEISELVKKPDINENLKHKLQVTE